MSIIFSIKTVKDYIPLVYIFLICLGYFSNSLYWGKFDIDIIYYMTFIELLFLFIPLGAALAGILLATALIVAPAVISGGKGIVYDFSKFKNEDGDSETILREEKRNKQNRFVSGILFFIEIYLHLVPLVLLLYLVFSTQFEFYFSSKISMVLILVWMMIFFMKYSVVNKNKTLNKKRILIVFSVFIIVMFLFTLEIRLSQAEDILEGKPLYNINFKNGSDHISTTENLIYIGQTNDYIFLRNLNKNENLIYQKSEIRELVLKKN